jgi:hypothetical protein
MGRYATLVRGPVKCEADLIDRIRKYDVWPASIGKPAFPPPKRSRPRDDKKGPRARKDDRGRGRGRERERGRDRKRGRGPGRGRGRPKKS